MKHHIYIQVASRFCMFRRCRLRHLPQTLCYAHSHAPQSGLENTQQKPSSRITKGRQRPLHYFHQSKASFVTISDQTGYYIYIYWCVYVFAIDVSVFVFTKDEHVIDDLFQRHQVSNTVFNVRQWPNDRAGIRGNKGAVLRESDLIQVNAGSKRLIY